MKVESSITMSVSIWFAFNMFFLLGCDKSDSNSNAASAPENLVVDITLAGADADNPNGDGSGMLTVNASANNAVRYAFRFDNGDLQESETGFIEHTFTKDDVNSYTIVTWAYAENGEFINETNTVEVLKADIALDPVSSEEFDELVFSDEFNVDGAPNAQVWGYDLGDGGWGNNELQTYTSNAENVIVEDGFLKITARADDDAGYTSARLKSQDLYEFTYGRIEISAKLPAEQGTWPALWALGANFDEVGWPTCGELDIMEQTGWNKFETSAAIHFPENFAGNAPTNAIENNTATTEFRTYSLEWDTSEIKMFVDDTPVLVFANDSGKPFNQDFFFIMNVAMGGTLGGDIAPDFSQATMEIDYIRVYQ